MGEGSMGETMVGESMRSSAFVEDLRERSSASDPRIERSEPLQPMSDPGYPAWTRLGDWLAGWRDGRRGMPDVTANGNDFRCAKIDSLNGHFDKASSQLSVAFEESTAEDRANLTRLRHQVGDLSKQLATHERKLAELIARGPSTQVRIGEEKLGIEFSMIRREREFKNELNRRQQLVTGTRTSLASAAAEAEVLDQRIRSREGCFESQRKALLTTHNRRLAAYLAGVSRTHPNPSAIAMYQRKPRADLHLVDLREGGPADEDRNQFKLFGVSS